MLNDNIYQFSLAFILLISVWYVEKLKKPYIQAFIRANWYVVATVIWMVAILVGYIFLGNTEGNSLEEWVLFMIILISLHAVATAVPFFKKISPVITKPVNIQNYVIIIICALVLIFSALVFIEIYTDITIFGIPLDYTPAVEPYAE
jgi:hypothetical protein